MLYIALIWAALWFCTDCVDFYGTLDMTFPGPIWHHRLIGGNCLAFASGVINCNRKASSFEEGRQRLRQYARKLQNLGCPVCLRDVKIITVSASHTLSARLDLNRLAQDRTLLYKPELFPVLNVKMGRVNFRLLIPYANSLDPDQDR